MVRVPKRSGILRKRIVHKELGIISRLEVRIQAGDKQYFSCLLIQETKIMKILNILTSLYHVEHNTCTVLGQGDGVPKAGAQQAAADSRGSRTCVCANTFVQGVAHAGGRRMN